MKTRSSTTDRIVISVHIRIMTLLLVGVVAFAGMWSGGRKGASAQPGGFTPGCSPSIFHKAHTTWTATERDLAAPDAPPDVVTAVTDVIEKVYRPDRTMDYTALDALATPAFHEMTGLDCSGVPTPPARPTQPATSPVAGSSEASPVAIPGPAYLDQVRQTDDGIVSAFLVQPGMLFVPNPDATPGSGVSSEIDPETGVIISTTGMVTDAVSFVVFVQRDGEWMIDYLSDMFMQFSDVEINDPQLRQNGLLVGVEASKLRDHGMQELPPDVTLIASPEATPAG
ncbi:MAG: hypothetical protein ACR2OU_15340 [Thermomicrobiales bacterium]